MVSAWRPWLTEADSVVLRYGSDRRSCLGAFACDAKVRLLAGGPSLVALQSP